MLAAAAPKHFGEMHHNVMNTSFRRYIRIVLHIEDGALALKSFCTE